jgi:hypothetical protein
MKLRVGTRVCIWYRYPSEMFPRELTARVLNPHRTVHDAVARAIVKDFGYSVVLDEHPTQRLLDHLSSQPPEQADAVRYALAFASIRPPPYVPPMLPPTGGLKREMTEEGEGEGKNLLRTKRPRMQQ